MNTIKHATMVAMMAAMTMGTSAQALRSAYFSDSYIYRHNMNPALANDDGYVSFPLLGNMSLDLGMTFGVSDFIKKGPNGTLVTALHPSVSAPEFINDLPDELKMKESFDMTILSIGFNGLGGYNTLEFGVHEQVGMQLPKDMFVFMKEMQAGKKYEFSDLRMNARGWVDVAYGHSHAIGEALRIGAKVKLLVGVVNFDANLDGAEAYFGQDKWQMKLHGNITMGTPGGAMFETNKDGYVDGIGDFDIGSGIAGWGYSVDLGATYDMEEIVEGLKLSAAVTDLGSITWEDCAYAYNEGTPFEFGGFTNLAMHDNQGSGSLNDQWDALSDDLDKMLNLRLGSRKDVTESLAATVTGGVEYEMPFYRNLSVGLLYTQRFDKMFGFQEGRAVLNFAPGKVFDMSVSGAMSNWGTSLGGVLNLHLAGLNLFVGSDYVYTGKVNSDMVPLEKSGLNLQVGLNLPFGR